MPTKFNDHANLLTTEMKVEKEWLASNAPIFNNPLTEEYATRAKAFNISCAAIGATSCMVIEKEALTFRS